MSKAVYLEGVNLLYLYCADFEGWVVVLRYEKF